MLELGKMLLLDNLTELKKKIEKFKKIIYYSFILWQKSPP